MNKQTDKQTSKVYIWIYRQTNKQAKYIDKLAKFSGVVFTLLAGGGGFNILTCVTIFQINYKCSDNQKTLDQNDEIEA